MNKIELAVRKQQLIEQEKELYENSFIDSDSYEVDSSQSENIIKMKSSTLMNIKELIQKKIISPKTKQRELVDEFRDLRTNLLRKSKGRNFTLMVTSVVPNGGASFVASNIAAAFALDQGKTSLLVDCNIAEPSVHKQFDLDNDIGLTDFIASTDVDVKDLIRPTGVKRLNAITVGSKIDSAVEYFTSIQMRKLTSHLKNRYPDRFVVLDAPCINASADASILSDLCDMVILVAPYGKTSSTKVGSALEAIGPAKCAGVIINDRPAVQL